MAGMTTPQDSADAAQLAADAARAAAEQAGASGGADPLAFQISIFVMAVLLGACCILAGRGGGLRNKGAAAALVLAVVAVAGMTVTAQAGGALAAWLGLGAVALGGAVSGAMVLVLQDKASGGDTGQ